MNQIPNAQEFPFHNKNIMTLMIKLVSLRFTCQYSRYEEGPIINNYFFKPLPTTPPLSTILNKEEDLAMAVGAEHLIIKRELDEISIAVPRTDRQLIKFDSMLYWLASNNYKSNRTLPILMGCTTKGENFTIDLIEQPHLIIAGSTGSGKSVFLNQLLCTLAVLKEPNELEMILIDTKQLDLVLMSQLEHVKDMIDKITDIHPMMDRLLKEVRKRTNLFKGVARNLKEYNSLGLGPKLPYILVVVDELADIIGQDKELAKSEDKDSKRTRITDSLQSLIQISRAAGIHFILATQRPDSKLLTGIIKANCPARISFKLPSQIDSRVVLDDTGAEHLLGKGDYLFKTGTDSTIRRAHGSFVQLDDIAKILDQHQFIRDSFKLMR